MFKEIGTIDEFTRHAESDEAALFYFSTPDCNVCKTLRPLVDRLISTEFPAMSLYYVNMAADPVIAAQNMVFTVPTILVYFNGREYFRKSRHFGIDELKREIARPYELMGLN